MDNRYEFMFFVEAKDCNPNGDPDCGNQPRMDAETSHGYITDMCLKRLIRDYVGDAFNGVPGMDIIMRSGNNLNRDIAKVIQETNNGEFPKKKTNGKLTFDASKKACELFYDVRTFGAVLATGKNAGAIQGPVQFKFADSLSQINPQDKTITRVCYVDDYQDKPQSMEEYDEIDAKLDNDKKRSMGRKQFIHYGLYVVEGYVSANLANKTMFTENDLHILFEAIMNMYDYKRSASKNGMNVVGPLIIFKHIGTQNDKNSEQNKREAILGCARASKLFDLVHIEKKQDVIYPRNYRDYDISIDMKHIPNGINVGFKDNAFGDIIWNTLPSDENWIHEK